MGVGAAELDLPTGSTWLVDDRGVALRATWRLRHGFINLSIWRDDRCVETFHLSPTDAAELIGFLVNGLADVASVPAAAPVVSLAPEVPKARPRAPRLRSSLLNALRTATDRLER